MKKLLLLLFLISSSQYFAQRVLFIGNSYTYVNDLPGMVDSVASHFGKNLTTGSKTNGGYTFQNHYEDAATYTAMHQQEWDLIVLQAQSQEPSFPYDQVTTATLPYSTMLADSAYASSTCGNVMYYMTWGRENGDPQWDSINTFDKMNERLYNAYMRFANETDAMVSPVAVAWKYVRDNYPAIQLYVGDGSHPSVEGTYLIANTFYASIYQESPIGGTYTAGLDPTTVTALQTAADWAVMDSLQKFGLHPIDYRTVAGFQVTETSGTLETENTSIHASSYVWDFGDGNTSTETTPTHQYSVPGTYTIQLIASSACNSDTISFQLTVYVVGIEEQHFPVEIEDFPGYYSITAVDERLEYRLIGTLGQIITKGALLPHEHIELPKENAFGVLQISNPNNETVTRKYVR